MHFMKKDEHEEILRLRRKSIRKIINNVNDENTMELIHRMVRRLAESK